MDEISSSAERPSVGLTRMRSAWTLAPWTDGRERGWSQHDPPGAKSRAALSSSRHPHVGTEDRPRNMHLQALRHVLEDRVHEGVQLEERLPAGLGVVLADPELLCFDVGDGILLGLRAAAAGMRREPE